DEDHPEECANIVLFHYFSDDSFNRRRVFTTADRFNKFLALDLSGSNKIFQDHVRNLTQGAYPFPGAEAPANELEDAYDELRANLGRLEGYARSLEQTLKGSQDYSRQLEARVQGMEQALRDAQAYQHHLEAQLGLLGRRPEVQK